MKNFLTATIKVPVKIDENGEFIMLENYAEINIEKMTTPPKLTFQSLYEKMIEYIHQNPEYLANIISSQKTIDLPQESFVNEVNKQEDREGKEEPFENKEDKEEESFENKEEDREEESFENKEEEPFENEEDKEEEPFENEEDREKLNEEKPNNETPNTVVTLLHKFHYFNKSKTPLNSSFRNKKLKRNFTKKLRL